MARPQKQNPNHRNRPKLKKNTEVDMNRDNTRINSRKWHFHKLMQKQQELEQSKIRRRTVIEAKREARKMKRKERNSAWCKLTKKGQPIMKERINYLLKELERMNN